MNCFLSGSESALLFSNNYKRIVVIPTFTSVLTDQKNTYIMSMDSNQEPETVDGTDRVYTLCLRAQKREEGKAPTISNAMDPIAVEGGTLYSMLKGKRISSREEDCKLSCEVSFDIQRRFDKDSDLGVF